MAIRKDSPIIRQNVGWVKADEVIGLDKQYVLSMHTGNGVCSFTNLLVSKTSNSTIFNHVEFESSCGEKHTLEATSDTQVLTTLGWTAVKDLDWTAVVINYRGMKCKVTKNVEVKLGGDSCQPFFMVSMATAFNRNIVVDGIVVREPDIELPQAAIEE